MTNKYLEKIAEIHSDELIKEASLGKTLMGVLKGGGDDAAQAAAKTTATSAEQAAKNKAIRDAKKRALQAKVTARAKTKVDNVPTLKATEGQKFEAKRKGLAPKQKLTLETKSRETFRR